MRIECAIEYNHSLEVRVDGKLLRAGEKYTILERGYAVFLLENEDDEQWVEENGDTIPADPEDHCAALRSHGNMLITADPVLVALALESWWSANGEPKPQGVPLPIPTSFEAVQIVRNRKILNEFNKKWEGLVPGLRIMNKGRKKNCL